MKRYLHDQDTIEAMSTINPQLCKKLQIQVEVEQLDEGPIPHVHVYHDSSRSKKKCSYIRLDKAEYMPNHNSIPLTRKVKKQFLELMKSNWGCTQVLENGNVVTLTGYQRAVEIWCDTFEEGSYDKFELDDNGLPKMPDYSSL